ncbi:MAG: TIGR04255 family protein [Deltaproteobacteria bacterium]|nr:TIGR04255 family protein [Deltaproteobacteria bacterium]
MPETIIFKNAPITEAILDIRATLPKDIKLENLLNVYDAVKLSYPNKRERIAFQGQFQFRPNILPELREVKGGPDGYLFSTADGKQTIQARLDGFTFNRFKPYDRWETFREEGRKLWTIYASVSNPKEVTRVALRYINRIEIPLPIRDFKDYIVTIPEIASGIPQGLANFLMRLVIPVDELQAVAIITESMEPPVANNVVAVILDIDVFRQGSFDIHSQAIWDIFENLHDLKNNIFFRSITEKAKELFD